MHGQQHINIRAASTETSNERCTIRRHMNTTNIIINNFSVSLRITTISEHKLVKYWRLRAVAYPGIFFEGGGGVQQIQLWTVGRGNGVCGR
jgi:hypothetical protein